MLARSEVGAARAGRACERVLEENKPRVLVLGAVTSGLGSAVGRSEVREVSGAMSQECSKVSDTRGLHKEPASATGRRVINKITFYLDRLVGGRLVSRSCENNGKSARGS